MKVIGFLGYSEKIDLVCSYAKTLQLMGNTVLVVDATYENKYKYVVPTIDTADEAFLTQYDGVDYAVGFNSLNEVENYLCDARINISLYDYLILDIDNPKKYEYFRSKTADKSYFIFDTNMLALRKNEELINSMKVYNVLENEENKIHKIMYRAYITRTAEKYFETRLDEMSTGFSESTLEIQEDERDKSLFLDSLISGYMNLKKHSKVFINSLSELIKEVEPEHSVYQIRKIIKKGGI